MWRFCRTQNLPAGTDESSVLIRTLSHTLCALLATLTTGRSLRLVQRSEYRTEKETVGGGKRTEDCGSKIRNAASRVAAGIGWQSGKVRGNVDAWEHQVDVYEKLAT